MSHPEPAAGAEVDIIAIGASAGGLQPLRTVVAALPADLPASVLVVMHVAPAGTSVLPQILTRGTKVEVVAASDGLALRPGLVVVAVPDRHLIVAGGAVRLTRGPRKNGHRPAIDPLLRSLAAAYGPRAAGVILSGTRDDGTQGLAEITARGGVALVQDPEQAEHPAMPRHAIAGAAVDAVLPAEELGPALVDLAHGRPDHRAPAVPPTPLLSAEQPVVVTCPDCGGVLTEKVFQKEAGLSEPSRGGWAGPVARGSPGHQPVSPRAPAMASTIRPRSATPSHSETPSEADEAGVMHFRCHVGHGFSPRSLLALHADGVERAMWTAARSLEDRGMLLRRLAGRARRTGNAKTAAQFDRDAERADDESMAIRRAIAALDDSYVAEAPNGQEAIG